MRFSIIILLVLIVVSQGYTQELVSWLDLARSISTSSTKEVSETGESYRYFDEKGSMQLLPGALPTSITRKMKEFAGYYGTEALYLLPVQEFNWDLKSSSVAYNTLRNVNSLAGIEYYSASRGRYRIMFFDSYEIADKDSRVPIPNPVYTTPPENESLLLYYKDSSFGQAVHRASYWFSDHTITLLTENQTKVKYQYIFPVADFGEMFTMLQLYPVQEGILVYGLILVEGGVPALMESKARNSFRYRIRAMFDWFSANYVENLR